MKTKLLALLLAVMMCFATVLLSSCGGGGDQGGNNGDNTGNDGGNSGDNTGEGGGNTPGADDDLNRPSDDDGTDHTGDNNTVNPDQPGQGGGETPDQPGEDGGEEPDEHKHVYVDGKCECGAEDPNKPGQGGDGNTDDDGWTKPEEHKHVYVDGKCECGVTDPDYVAPDQPGEGDENEEVPFINATYNFPLDQVDPLAGITKFELHDDGTMTVYNAKGQTETLDYVHVEKGFISFELMMMSIVLKYDDATATINYYTSDDIALSFYPGDGLSVDVFGPYTKPGMYYAGYLFGTDYISIHVYLDLDARIVKIAGNTFLVNEDGSIVRLANQETIEKSLKNADRIWAEKEAEYGDISKFRAEYERLYENMKNAYTEEDYSDANYELYEFLNSIDHNSVGGGGSSSDTVKVDKSYLVTTSFTLAATDKYKSLYDYLSTQEILIAIQYSDGTGTRTALKLTENMIGPNDANLTTPGTYVFQIAWSIGEVAYNGSVSVTVTDGESGGEDVGGETPDQPGEGGDDVQAINLTTEYDSALTAFGYKGAKLYLDGKLELARADGQIESYKFVGAGMDNLIKVNLDGVNVLFYLDEEKMAIGFYDISASDYKQYAEYYLEQPYSNGTTVKTIFYVYDMIIDGENVVRMYGPVGSDMLTYHYMTTLCKVDLDAGTITYTGMEFKIKEDGSLEMNIPGGGPSGGGSDDSYEVDLESRIEEALSKLDAVYENYYNELGDEWRVNANDAYTSYYKQIKTAGCVEEVDDVLNNALEHFYEIAYEMGYEDGVEDNPGTDDAVLIGKYRFVDNASFFDVSGIELYENGLAKVVTLDNYYHVSKYTYYEGGGIVLAYQGFEFCISLNEETQYCFFYIPSGDPEYSLTGKILDGCFEGSINVYDLPLSESRIVTVLKGIWTPDGSEMSATILTDIDTEKRIIYYGGAYAFFDEKFVITQEIIPGGDVEDNPGSGDTSIEGATSLGSYAFAQPDHPIGFKDIELFDNGVATLVLSSGRMADCKYDLTEGMLIFDMYNTMFIAVVDEEAKTFDFLDVSALPGFSSIYVITEEEERTFTVYNVGEYSGPGYYMTVMKDPTSPGAETYAQATIKLYLDLENKTFTYGGRSYSFDENGNVIGDDSISGSGSTDSEGTDQGGSSDSSDNYYEGSTTLPMVPADGTTGEKIFNTTTGENYNGSLNGNNSFVVGTTENGEIVYSTVTNPDAVYSFATNAN